MRRGVAIVPGEVPGHGEQREMLQPGDLPDLLDVARLLLGAVVDAERVPVGRGAPAGHRISEPVRADQVGPLDAEDLPLPGQQPAGGSDDGGPGLGRDRGGRARRQDRCEAAPARLPARLPAARPGGRRRRQSRRKLSAADLPPCPGGLPGLVPGTPGQLRWRHPAKAAHVPAQPGGCLHAHTRTGTPRVQALADRDGRAGGGDQGVERDRHRRARADRGRRTPRPACAGPCPGRPAPCWSSACRARSRRRPGGSCPAARCARRPRRPGSPSDSAGCRSVT